MTYNQIRSATASDLPRLIAYKQRLDVLIRLSGSGAKKTEAQNKHGMVKEAIRRLAA